MDRRRAIMDNPYERAVERILVAVAGRHGASVFPKVRIADALDVRGSGISDEAFGYALKAHFDFVVTEPSSRPLFAVEFDGATHRDASVARRDRMKDDIAAVLGLPLLRADASFLPRIGSFSVLGWLCEMWFQYRICLKERERGVPEARFFFTTLGYRNDGAYCLDAPGHAVINEAFERRETDTFVPDDGWRWLTDGGAEAYAVLALVDGGSVVGHARCRPFRFPPANPAVVARQLAIVDCGKQLQAVLSGKRVPWSAETVDELRRTTADWRWHRSGPWPHRDRPPPTLDPIILE
jgi:hypothetical protein